MEHKKFLSFQGKNEYTLIRNRVQSYGLGKLRFAFLDVDWHEKEREALALKERSFVEASDHESILDMQDASKNYNIAAEYYKRMYREMSALHPFLAQTVSEMLEDAVNEVLYPQYQASIEIMFELFQFSMDDPKIAKRMRTYQELNTPDFSLVESTREFVKRLPALCADMAAFKEDLIRIAEIALDREADEAYPIWRYYEMQEDGFASLLRAQKAAGLPMVEQRILPEDALDGDGEGYLTFHAFYTARDIRTLIFAEFQYMSANDYVITKCQHCNRYFLPHSKASIYCDRLADPESGKSCKEFASVNKYLWKVSTDQAKKLYNRYRNNYQMRVRRDPEAFPYQGYADWMDSARPLLKEVQAGALSVEEFERRIALPGTKEARRALKKDSENPE